MDKPGRKTLNADMVTDMTHMSWIAMVIRDKERTYIVQVERERYILSSALLAPWLSPEMYTFLK